MSRVKKQQGVWFSGILSDKRGSRLIAYLGVITALNVVENAYFSFSLGVTQFSLTIFMSVLTGILIGPLFGFASCMVGDFLGYFIGTGSANNWTPWLGLATALMALFGGLIFNGLNWQGKRAWVVKLSLIALVTFLICTVAINTTALYLLWYRKTFSTWWLFLLNRLFLQGQILNSIANYVLLFLILPALAKVKILKIKL